MIGWARVSPYDDAHDYYSGVGEATLYVERAARRGGAGGALLAALAAEAERRGYHKLIGKIFNSNQPSIALVRSCGWREVGVHRRHGRFDGEWKDVAGGRAAAGRSSRSAVKLGREAVRS